MTDLAKSRHFTRQQARSAARWIRNNVPGAALIQIVEDLESGDVWIRYLNRCNVARLVNSPAELDDLKAGL